MNRILSALTLMLASITVNAAIIEITPDYDGRIRNIHSSSPMILPADAYLESFTSSDSSWETRIAMEFATSAISGAISSAELLLPAATSVLTGTVLDVFAYSGNGTLELADVFSGTQVATFNPTTSSSHTVSLDTGILQTLLDGGATYFGLMIAVSDSNQQAYWQHAANSTISTLRINTEAVPEPATLALMGLGLAGIGFARKKRAA
ncbi:MAG: PEP-CTERM sorting domain-containing protein [Sedimenticola sp.]